MSDPRIRYFNFKYAIRIDLSESTDHHISLEIKHTELGFKDFNVLYFL